MIRMQRVAFSYDNAPFIRELSCEMADGRITGLLGPNGSGKSTCLKLCAGLLRPASGEIQVGGAPVLGRKPREFARELAFLPQSRPLPAITVRSLVENGRFPYLGLSRRLSPADRAAVDSALQMTGMAALAERELRTLSGGERQKAYLAMLIAQGAQHLLLDEPTTYLDINHQLELMEILRTLRDAGRCVVMVLHDIDLAAEVCDHIIVMQRGGVIHSGAVATLFDSGALERAYGVRPLPGMGTRFERT